MKYPPGTQASQGVRHLRRPCGQALVTVLVATMVIPPQLAVPVAVAQSSSSPTQPAANAGGNLSPAQLNQLVARIALYSDPLLAIVLPASTQMAEIVEAQRFLDQHATDPSAKPPATWAPSVVSLLNYPDVVRMMSNDLDWTQQLGDAVVTQQQDVMAAIQRFRQQAYAAGNLTSNDRVQVTVQNGASAAPATTAISPGSAPASRVAAAASVAPVIQIQSASPTVLYVPQYDPAVVVAPVPAGYPPPYAYSPPYPAYISPSAPFFTGAVFGAAVGFGLSWASGSIFSGALGGGGNVTNVNINNINNHFSTFEHNGANIWHPDHNAIINANNRRLSPNNHGIPPNGGGGNLLYGARNSPNAGENRPEPQAPNNRPNAAGNRLSGGENPRNGAENRGPDRAGAAGNRGENPPNSGGSRYANQASAGRNRAENPSNGNAESRYGNQARSGENRPNGDEAGRRSMADVGPRGDMRGGGAFTGVDQPRSQAERAQVRGNASLRRADSGPRRGPREAGGVHRVNERRR